MLHDALYGLYLVERNGLSSFPEAEEVADEDWVLLFIDSLGPSLEFIVVTQTCGQLQLGNGLWIPGVKDAVLAPRELTLILQERLLEGLLSQTDGIAGNFFQPNAADGAHLRAEIPL